MKPQLHVSPHNYYSPALKKWGLYWICLVLAEFCGSVILSKNQMKLEYLWSRLANVDQILYEVSLGWGKGCIRFQDKLDQNPGSHGNRKRPLTYNGENDVSHLFSVVFDPIHFILAGNKDMHKIWEEFEFRQDRTTDYGLAALEHLKNFP